MTLEKIVFTHFDLEYYEIYIFQDGAGDLITLKIITYEE